MAARPSDGKLGSKDRAALLPLVATIGFVGHRALEDSEETGGLIGQAFDIIWKTFESIADVKLPGGEETLGNAYNGPRAIRLLTGNAPGSDRLAIECWQNGSRGPLHVLYPFRDPRTGNALTEDPSHSTEEAITVEDYHGASWSGLDGLSLGLRGEEAHVEVGQWIVRHCDILVAVWNGAQAAGPGGTEDTVRRALARGAPVIWLCPGDNAIYLLHSPAIARGYYHDEVLAAPLSYRRAVSVDEIADIMFGIFAPPGGAHGNEIDREVAARRDFARVDPLRPRRHVWWPIETLLEKTAWRSFSVFKAWVGDDGGWHASSSAPQGKPDALIGQLPALEYIQDCFNEADRRANYLSGIHRSQQLILIFIAILAVTAGAFPSVFRDTSWENEAHVISAAVEFILGVTALSVAYLARRAHRHRRWSDTRRLAERLRAASATWPLGADLADNDIGPAHTWTEWRARAILRAAGPPTGWLDADQLQRRLNWAKFELIHCQVRYHSKEAHECEHIQHRIHVVENVAFITLILSLGGFLVAQIICSRLDAHLPAWVGGWVSVIGAVAPAIGTAGLALEATNGFSDLALRSARLRNEFERLLWECGHSGASSLRHVQEVMKAASRLLVEDTDSWRDRVASRRILRGG